jgi:hypothetical protein
MICEWYKYLILSMLWFCQEWQPTIKMCNLHLQNYIIHFIMYVRYPENKFQWAIEKKTIYFQTIYIAIWCTYLTLLFDIVSTIFETLAIVGHKFLCPCIIEWCHCDANHVLTASLTSSWNHWLPRKVFRCRNTWKSPGAKSELQGEWWNCSPPNVAMRFCVAVAVCGRAL